MKTNRQTDRFQPIDILNCNFSSFQIFNENPSNGAIKIFLSNDSTCSSIAHGKHRTHSETLTLYPIADTNWPDNHDYCHMPRWMHGHWEHLAVSAQTAVYRDHSSFKTYTMKCAEIANHVPANENDVKFKVFSRTQCGEEQYNCIWAIKRSANILEFQIGAKAVDNLFAMASDDICDSKHFDETRWLTQARIDHNVTIAPCPLGGELNGMLPDADRLCAKLSSECETPDQMRYQVSLCDFDEVVEGKHCNTSMRK